MLQTRLARCGWLGMPSGIGQQVLRALCVDDVLASSDAGARDVLAQPWCAALAATLRERLSFLGILTTDTVAVQCTLFRKTRECNWKVPYHQDLSVPVAERIDHASLSGWSMKPDGHYVQPPTMLLERLLAVRLHLDDCRDEEGPLRVLPGSHRFGRLQSSRIAMMIKREGEVACHANTGDLMLMRPLLLHASSKALRPNGRRVLHFLFAPREPGCGLRWRMMV